MITWRWLVVILIFSMFTVSCAPNRLQLQKDQRKQSQSKIQSITPEKVKPLESHGSSTLSFIPTAIIIPSIQVFARIKPVGVLANGQMDVPKSTDLIGVLHPGVLAGAKGNLVMDGHVDSYTGPAVLFNLKKLTPEDVIIVRDNNNHQLTYKVQSVETFITSEAPIERIFGESDEIRLNIITCTGTYSRKKKEHQKRLVVFAKLVDTEDIPL